MLSKLNILFGASPKPDFISCLKARNGSKEVQGYTLFTHKTTVIERKSFKLAALKQKTIFNVQINLVLWRTD